MPLSYKLTTFFLIVSVAIFEAGTNILLPVLPTLQVFFETDVQTVQSTLSFYLLGFSLLGLFAGPLSDQLGRRTLILAGLILFWFGSFLGFWCVSTSLDILLFSRFLQGLGAGVCTVISIAIIRDLFDTLRAARMLSLMGMVTAVAPMVSPLLGGALAHFWHWTDIFLLMFLVACVLLMVFTFWGEESLYKTEPFQMKKLVAECRQVLRNKTSVGFILISSLAYGSLFAWIVQAPFFFQEHFFLSDIHYAFYAALGPAIYIFGSFTNYLFLPRYGILKLLSFGLILSFLGCMMLMLLITSHSADLWSYMCGFLFFNGGVSFVFANACAAAIDRAGDCRGTASAILASSEQFFAAIAAFIVGFFPHQTLLPAILLMTFSVLGAGFIYLKMDRGESLAL